jgi:arylsulfatase A-like enzyme
VDSIYCGAQAEGLTTAMVQEAGGPKLFEQCLDSPIFPEIPKDDRRTADDIILEESLAALQEEPNLLWIHFSGSDWSGHHYGGASEEYRQFAREIDTRIAKIAEAMDLDSAVLIVNSDHGHIDTGGHGGWEEEVVSAPLVIAGEGIKPGSYGEVEQANIAPTVAALLGSPIPTHNQGQPMYDLLDMPLQASAERAVDVARQHQLFYGQYLSVIGASA